MRKYVKPVKNFVVKHRTALAVTGTALICLYIHGLSMHQHTEFLKEHDLLDAFYNIES